MPPKRRSKPAPRSPFAARTRFKANQSKLKLPKAAAAAARLDMLELPKALRAPLRDAGITSAVKLALLPAGKKKALARKAGISVNDLDLQILRSRNLLGSAAVLSANTLAFGGAGVPSWLQSPDADGCGCCPETRSVISRFAYFQYLITRTGRTIAALDAELFQDFQALTPDNGVGTVQQVALVNTVFGRAYPGPLTHAENLPFTWLMVKAALGIAPMTPDDIVAAISAAAPALGGAGLASRIAAWLPAAIPPPASQFTSAEIMAIATVVESTLRDAVAAEVDSDPAMASASVAERQAETRARVDRWLAPARRDAAVLRREMFKARAGLSDAQLFGRYFIEADLGPCENTTRLDQAIRTLQAWLDAGLASAPTAEARSALAYQTFEVWRAERIGEIFPELAAFFRDDLLTGRGDVSTRGSMLVDRAATREALRSQLADVRAALPNARIQTGQDYATADPFVGTAFHTHFERGLEVIDRVLEADDAIVEAVSQLDADQPGLALAALGRAEQTIAAAGRRVFLTDSPWRRPEETSLRALGELAPAERGVKLILVGSELLLEPKAIFLTDLNVLRIAGLDVHTGLLDSVARWQLGTGFHLGTSGGERGKLLHDRGDATAIDVAFYSDGATLGDYTVSAEVRLTEAGWTHAESNGELVGLEVRRDAGRSYRLVVISEWVTSTTFVGANPGVHVDINTGNATADTILDFGAAVLEEVTTDQGEAVTTSSMQLVFVLQHVDGGTVTELARDATFLFFDVGDVATFSATVTGNRIEGRFSNGGEVRIASTTHTGASANRQGTLGLVATRTIGAVFGPIKYTLVSESAGHYPPFYAARRAELPNRHLLDSSTIYQRHIEAGAPVAARLPVSALVTDTQATFVQPLAYVKTNNKQLNLLFAAGQRGFVLDALDELLDYCLTFVFHLRYVAIPLRAAQCHLRTGDYDTALAMLRMVYDETAPGEAAREVTPFLVNPPAGIDTSVGADARLMRLRLAEVHLAMAEWLFRRNSDQDRYEARRHLEQLLALHDRTEGCRCGEIYAVIPLQLSATVAALIRANGWTTALAAELDRRVTGILDALEDARQRVVDEVQLATIAQQLSALPSDTAAALSAALWQVEQQIRGLASAPSPSMQGWSWSGVTTNLWQRLERAELIDRPSYADLLDATALGPVSVSTLLLGVSSGLCVPQNPMMNAQVRRACVMLDHLRHCRNILGYDERLAPPLRFEALMSMANGFADLALAAEKDLLNFRQSSEAEAFSLLSAQNQLAFSDATVQIERLKVQQAIGDVQGAALQVGQAAFAAGHYASLIANGLNNWEKLAIGAAWTSVGLSLASMLPAAASVALAGVGAGVTATGVGAVPGAGMALVGALGTLASAATGGLNSAVSAASGLSQVATMMASYERREEEWRFQRGMAAHSMAIAENALAQAAGRVTLAREEQAIAELQRGLAARGVEFLSNKFLNREMYIWMVRTAREQYRTRLNYAIEAAYMAERALALELQQDVDIIRFDYFDPRRDGLLGAVQLQTDLAALQHRRLIQRQRDLQLSKTISMALTMSGDLQKFREGPGVLPFSTRQEWFDRDFPGHHLRLIKSVRVTVVALVPPLDGIHGALTHSGISRTIVGPPFREQMILRRPETIAISAPYQATGVFVLDYRDEFLLPFEGSGVESDWLFELPRATNAFDYGTIADVLVTIDYTARSSQPYRQIVQQRLGNQMRGERPFAFAQELPDQWYELHNPAQSATPMQVSFASRRADYPANLTDVVIDHVTLLLAPPSGATPVNLAGIGLTLDYLDAAGAAQSVSGTATATNGVATTRRPPAGGHPWSPLRGKPAIGTWKLTFPDNAATRALFDSGAVGDLLLVVSYTAKNAAWA